ncbi:MAG: hypothetical protein ABSF70_06755 [Terracidiphilus sp.]|jgi:hypothetical protein
MNAKGQSARILKFPELVDSTEAARLLNRPPTTLKRWRYEGVGPDWIEMEGKISYDVAVLLEYIKRNTRIASVRAAREEIRGLV